MRDTTLTIYWSLILILSSLLTFLSHSLPAFLASFLTLFYSASLTLLTLLTWYSISLSFSHQFQSHLSWREKKEEHNFTYLLLIYSGKIVCVCVLLQSLSLPLSWNCISNEWICWKEIAKFDDDLNGCTNIIDSLCINMIFSLSPIRLFVNQSILFVWSFINVLSLPLSLLTNKHLQDQLLGSQSELAHWSCWFDCHYKINPCLQL